MELLEPRLATAVFSGQLNQETFLITSDSDAPLSSVLSGNKKLPSWLDLELLTRPKKLDRTTPVLSYQYTSQSQINTELFFQVPSYFPPTAPLRSIVQTLSSALLAQAELLCKLLDTNSAGPASCVAFQLPTADCLVSLPFPSAPERAPSQSDNEADLLAVRTQHHNRLALPLDRPFVRLQNRFFGPQGSLPAASAAYLRSVHLALLDNNGNNNPSNNPNKAKPRALPQPAGGTPNVASQWGADGRLALVHGDYEYRHYKQDGFNDEGWGCAYRSLQTISSWLLLQDYTRRPVPSHRDIQKTLVLLGDKPASFVGSRQWIGAIEIQQCLLELYGLTCRIINVRSGADLAGKAAELARHFELEGTPVMIGGGVLAYTLLGVDWEPSSGQVKFLILDPHYTGGEHLATVLGQGWCAWKTVDLFRKDSFYNCCLPLRPRGI